MVIMIFQRNKTFNKIVKLQSVMKICCYKEFCADICLLFDLFLGLI